MASLKNSQYSYVFLVFEAQTKTRYSGHQLQVIAKLHVYFTVYSYKELTVFVRIRSIWRTTTEVAFATSSYMFIASTNCKLLQNNTSIAALRVQTAGALIRVAWQMRTAGAITRGAVWTRAAGAFIRTVVGTRTPGVFIRAALRTRTAGAFTRTALRMRLRSVRRSQSQLSASSSTRTSRS